MNLILTAVLLLVLQTSNIQAPNQHCKNGTTLKLGMDIEAGQNEKIIPAVDSDNARTSGIKCQWELSLTKVNAAIIVLTGVDANKVTARRWVRSIDSAPDETANTPYTAKLQYRLLGSGESVNDCSSDVMEHQHVVSVDTTSFRVLQLQRGSKISITYEQTSNVETQQSPALNVQVMEKGFCSTDIVNYDQGCYKISSVKKTIKTELRDINADGKVVKLASFDSPDALSKFVETSQLTVTGTGYNMRRKIPLDLSQPVRIGWFYNKRTGLISYLHATGSQCWMESLIINATNLNFTDISTDSTHTCGSLRVDQGKGIVEFRNCSEQLPALISFADTPRDECSNCSEPVVSWIKYMNKESGETGLGIDFIPSEMTVGIIAGCIRIASIIVVCAIVAFILPKIIKNNKNNKNNKITPTYSEVKGAPDSEQAE